MKRFALASLLVLVSAAVAAPTWNHFPPPQMAYNPSTLQISAKVTAGSANIAASNNYAAGAQQVIFTGSFGTVTGLTAGTVYFVTSATATTFQVSATSGGAVITPGGAGSATLTVSSAAPTLTVGDQVTGPAGVTAINILDGGTTNGEAITYDDFLNITFAGMVLPPGVSSGAGVVHFCAQGGANGSCLEITGASNEHSIIGQTSANGSFTFRVPDSLSGDLATIGAIAASALTQEIDGMITCTPTTGFIDTGGTGGFALPITGAPHVPGCTFRTTAVTGTTNSNLVLATGNTFAAMIFSSDQGLEWGLPTGGDKGHGTINAQGLFVQGVSVAPLTATSASIGGGALAAGACSSTATTVTGAAVGNKVVATPNTYPGDSTFWKSYVSAANTVTTLICESIAGTPTASTYNLAVFP